MPVRGIHSNLEISPIPAELQQLNIYESTVIQNVHPFQTIVHMQPKTSNVPPSELLRGPKGKVVYLPLDLKKNIETLGVDQEVEEPLVVLVNGVPTRNKKVGTN